MKICPHCGQYISDEAKRCQFCKNKQPESPPAGFDFNPNATKDIPKRPPFGIKFLENRNWRWITYAGFAVSIWKIAAVFIYGTLGAMSSAPSSLPVASPPSPESIARLSAVNERRLAEYEREQKLEDAARRLLPKKVVIDPTISGPKAFTLIPFTPNPQNRMQTVFWTWNLNTTGVPVMLYLDGGMTVFGRQYLESSVELTKRDSNWFFEKSMDHMGAPGVKHEFLLQFVYGFSQMNHMGMSYAYALDNLRAGNRYRLNVIIFWDMAYVVQFENLKEESPKDKIDAEYIQTINDIKTEFPTDPYIMNKLIGRLNELYGIGKAK